MSLPYEGNVRELQSLMARLVLFCQKTTASAEDIAPFLPQAAQLIQPVSERKEPVPGSPLIHSRKTLGREDLLDALARCDYNKERAAQHLGISRATLYRQMKKLGL